jgi:hypothetical protein
VLEGAIRLAKIGGNGVKQGRQFLKGMTGELDEVRGVLAALADRGNPLLQPVSTNAVTAALKRRNRSLDSGQCLDRLGRVGDVQRLRGGLWLPCSTTLVRCASLLVAVSGLPTPLLATELGGNPQTPGDSRTVAASSVAESDIRLRNFDSWCRAPASSLRWSDVFIANARYLQGTLTEGMEWHDHWTAGRRVRWSELYPDVDLERGPALARLRSRQGAAEHFLLRRHGGALQMADVPKVQGEHQRLRYALLTAAGNPVKFRLARQADGFIEVSVPRILPSSEAMVLAALGRALTDPGDWEQVFSLPESAWPQVERMLMGLGLVRSDAA